MSTKDKTSTEKDDRENKEDRTILKAKKATVLHETPPGTTTSTEEWIIDSSATSHISMGKIRLDD
jgi:hypothetical protein